MTNPNGTPTAPPVATEHTIEYTALCGHPANRTVLARSTLALRFLRSDLERRPCGACAEGYRTVRARVVPLVARLQA